jgi:hypothetical protein
MHSLRVLVLLLLTSALVAAEPKSGSGHYVCIVWERTTLSLKNPFLKTVVLRQTSIVRDSSFPSHLSLPTELRPRDLVKIANPHQFEAVSDVNPRSLRFGGHQYHRLNVDYEPIHRLCALFLASASISEPAGRFPFKGFLLDEQTL